MSDMQEVKFLVPETALDALNRGVSRTGQSQGDALVVAFVLYEAITFAVQGTPVYLRLSNTTGYQQTFKLTTRPARWWDLRYRKLARKARARAMS